MQFWTLSSVVLVLVVSTSEVQGCGRGSIYIENNQYKQRYQEKQQKKRRDRRLQEDRIDPNQEIFLRIYKEMRSDSRRGESIRDMCTQRDTTIQRERTEEETRQKKHNTI